MDVARAAHYIAQHRMELLLILSALFTTLTGVVTGVRAPNAPSARCAVVCEAEAPALAVAPQRAGHRHLLGEIGRRLTFAISLSAAVLPVAAPRLYLDRPRA